MALRAAHGSGDKPAYIEVTPADELPKGVPATEADPSGPLERRQNGRFSSSEAAREAGRRGGLKKAAQDPTKWAKRLGLGRHISKWTTEETMTPFIEEAERWYQATAEALARDVGGGQLSPGVMQILKTASWQKCFSDYLMDAATRGPFRWDAHAPVPAAGAPLPRPFPNTELVIAASRMGDSSRQNYIAAYEIAAREAQARARARDQEPYDLGAVLCSPRKT